MKFHYTDYAMGIWAMLFAEYMYPGGFGSLTPFCLITIPLVVLATWVWGREN